MRRASREEAKDADRSGAGLIIAWGTRDRKRRQLAATATRGEIEIRIDGNPEPFVYLRSEGFWVAVRRRQTQTITIAGQLIDPAGLDLRPLDNPVGDLNWAQPL